MQPSRPQQHRVPFLSCVPTYGCEVTALGRGTEAPCLLLCLLSCRAAHTRGGVPRSHPSTQQRGPTPCPESATHVTFLCLQLVSPSTSSLSTE